MKRLQPAGSLSSSMLLLLMAGCSKPEPSLPAVHPPQAAAFDARPLPDLDDCARRASMAAMTLKEAERVLRCTKIFAYGSMPDKPQVRAFNLLFEQPDAVTRFRSLSHEGQTAGRLYALAGLLLLDPAEGNRLARELSGSPETLTEVASDVINDSQSAHQLAASIAQRRLGHELRNAGREWETGLGTRSFCGAHASALPRSGPRLPPRDEAASKPDFLAFRHQLLETVARKDVRGLLRIADSGVVSDLGSGVEDLKRSITNPTQDFWGEFGRTLAMGGTFDDRGRFSTPYVYSAWPGEFDAIDCLAVTARNVPLRAKAAATAAVLARLDYDIVELVRDDAEIPGWLHVRLASGVAGFVASRFLRSSTNDYHAFFAVSGGVWRLEQFVVGG